MRTMENRFSLIKWGVIAAVVLSLAGCSTQDKTSGTDTKQSSPAKKLTVAYTWKPSGVDPHGADSWDVMRSGAGETLVRLNEKLEPAPWLAKEWKQEDPTTWVFKLQENATFHSGKAMDAESVKSSLQRSIEKSHLAKDLLQLKSVEVVAPHELKIVTDKPNAALVSNLADPSTIILDTASMDAKNGYPAMTGAFKIKQFNKDDSLVVERYPNYWGEPALLSEVTMKFVTDGNARLMALQSGQADVATDIPIDSAALLEKDNKTKVLSAPSLRTHMMLFNMKSLLFQDAANRRAVDQSIPREAIAGTVMKGYGTAAKGPFPSVLPFGKVERAAQNLTVGQLLTQGGWQKNAQGIWEKQGKPFEATLLTFPQRPELSVMAEVIQSQLLKEGIKINIRKVENIDDALLKDDWDLSMYSMLTAHTGEPQYFLNTFYRSNSESNVSRYVSQPLEQILDQLLLASDPAQRNQLAVQAQEIVNTDLPQSFIVHPNNVFGAKKGVQGFTPHPIEYYYIHSKVDMTE